MAPPCECAVCYSEQGPFRKLCCGHEFCGSCIKQWYLKGTGAGCPMCRRPIYFKGFHAVRDEWSEEHWRNKCLEVLDECRTAKIEETFEILGAFGPVWDALISRELVRDLKDLEKTARFLMHEDIAAEWIEYVLFETDDYFSDRKIGRPVKQAEQPRRSRPVTRYPKMQRGSGARGR